MSERIESKQTPAFRKGARRSVEVSCAVWIDLLGYRRQIAASHFNPLAPEAQEAIERIDRFHTIVARRSHRAFPTFAMNDGAIVYRDLSPRGGWVGAEVLFRAWELFQEVNADEETRGQPGARMIIAAGFRARRRNVFAVPSSHAESIWRRFESGKLTAESAIKEALHTNRYFDIVPQLQANFALTRAYLADAGGSKRGLPGPAAYVDVALLPERLPDWIIADEPIPWITECGDMKTSFRRLAKVIRVSDPKSFAGLDAISVGERLSGDANVQSKLHAARVTRLVRSGRSVSNDDD